MSAMGGAGTRRAPPTSSEQPRAAAPTHYLRLQEEECVHEGVEDCQGDGNSW
ncbi:MAG: hypothetical protein MJE68_12130 [Proteobacteria bacterium]|nr:hypothetical protein [Pseudomonadota bacterium]